MFNINNKNNFTFSKNLIIFKIKIQNKVIFVLKSISDIWSNGKTTRYTSVHEHLRGFVPDSRTNTTKNRYISVFVDRPSRWDLKWWSTRSRDIVFIEIRSQYLNGSTYWTRLPNILASPVLLYSEDVDTNISARLWRYFCWIFDIHFAIKKWN